VGVLKKTGVITLEEKNTGATLFFLFLRKGKKTDDRTINPIDR
ncbi:hypothetical protein, partial [Salmonella enterica]